MSTNRITPLLLATSIALSLAAGPVHAQNANGSKAAPEQEAPPASGGWGPGYGMGPGMMGGYGMGPGMMGGYGMGPGMMGGYGMGPGMMGGYGMGPGMMGGYGPGMMGGYGMGPGMMGGYGMGPGMMGGYGMGPGMMGGYGPGWGCHGARDVPDLTAEQRAKIGKIHDETRRKNWELMGRLMDEQAKLRDLYDAPKQDSAAINDAYKKISELQRRIYESSADAHKRMEAVLTKEQQEKWWRFWRHW